MRNPFPIALHLGGLLMLAWLYHQASPRPPTVSLASTSLVANPPEASAPAARSRSVVQMSPTAAPEPTPSLPDQIGNALRHGSPADRDRALLVLLPKLIAQDPAGAGQLALAWEPGPTRNEFLRQVIHHWAEADIGGVLTWLTSLLDTQDRTIAAATATAQVAQDDPAGALDLAQLLRVGLEDGSFEHLAQVWTEENPRAAMDWVVAQPAGPLRDRLLARIAWVRAQSEPAEAADLVLTRMQPGEAQAAATAAIVRQWALREPADATEWVAHFPEGTLRTRAVAALETARRTTAAR